MEKQLCTNCPKTEHLVSSEQPDTKGLKFCSQECEDEYTEKVKYMLFLERLDLDNDSDHAAGSQTPDR